MAEPNVGRQALDASRRREAAQLRDRGHRWPEIAERCGYDSPVHAFADVVHGARADRAAYDETIEDLRELERGRLEMALREAWKRYDSAVEAREEYDSRDPADQRGVSAPGDPGKYLEIVRKLSESLSKLLGLERAKEATDPEGNVLRIVLDGVDMGDL